MARLTVAWYNFINRTTSTVLLTKPCTPPQNFYSSIATCLRASIRYPNITSLKSTKCIFQALYSLIAVMLLNTLTGKT